MVLSKHATWRPIVTGTWSRGTSRTSLISWVLELLPRHRLGQRITFIRTIRCNTQQGNVELNKGVRRNKSRDSVASVCQMRPNAKAALPTDTHSLNAVFETRNDSPLTNSECASLIVLDLIATVQEEGISNIHNAAGLCQRSITERDILVLDTTATSVHV